MINAATNNGFSNKNTELLYMAMACKGFSSGKVAGYHQWRQLGRQVRKDEKGTIITRMSEKKTTNKNGETVTKKKPAGCVVFFIEQTDPITEE